MKHLILSLAVCLLPGAAFAQQSSVIDLMQRIQPSLVEVEAINAGIMKRGEGKLLLADTGGRRILRAQGLRMGAYERTGAGVIIHPSGIIITNAHTIHKAQEVRVILSGSTAVPAQVVRFLNDMDCALLQINPPAPLTAVVLADSNAISLGDEVLTVGNSQLLKETITGGKVSGLGTKRSGAKDNELIQTTMTLYKGDSGGPLFNRKGELIGLMTAKQTARDHSSFAIPSNKISWLLQDYLEEMKKGTSP